MIVYNTLFGKIGSLVARSNSYAALASTTLPADLATIAGAFGVAATTFGISGTPISGLDKRYAAFESAAVNFRKGLVPYSQNTFTDIDTIISQLVGLSATDINTVLKAIYRDMLDNAQTILADIATIGAVTALASNVGNGTALVDATLDGVNAPRKDAQANLWYNGALSQLTVPGETHQLVCTSAPTPGNESWSWTGGDKFDLFDFHPEGSGAGPGLKTAQGTTLLSNMSFTNFSANAPTSWTITAGVAGTDIFKETTIVFAGGSALRYTGIGSTQPNITQPLSSGSVGQRRRYLFTIQMRKGGAAPGAGNVTIKFTSASGAYTASGTEQINIALASLTGAYATYSFYINMPAVVPSDLLLNIGITGANLAAGANIYFDTASFTPVVYHGGVNCQVLQGSTAWAVGDRLKFTVGNGQQGKFAEWMRRAHKFQLPAVNAGNTISEALVV